MSEDQIINKIEKNIDEYVNFLRKLIQAESYNPPGNEKNVAKIIDQYLKGAGIKSEIFPFGENRANLVAYLNNNLESKNLLYNGHMDVVPPGNEEEWKYPPLSATIKGSKKKRKLFGRGAADMKTALAAMVISLKILKDLDLDLHGNLILNAVADEETGGKLGTEASLNNYLKFIKCDFIVIGETSGLAPLGRAISVGEKGHLNLKVTTNGVSCHSMLPTMGKNAINMMSEIIQNLDKIENYMPKIIPPVPYNKLKELLGQFFPDEQTFERILNDQRILQDILHSLTHFTKSFTMINGGIKENVIPDKCEGILDFRLLPGQSPETIINALKKMITDDLGYSVKSEPAGRPEEIFVYLEIYHQGEGSYWENWERSQTLQDLHNIIQQVYKDKPIFLLGPGATDAHYYRNSNYCQQTVIFGPGSLNKMHATNESIEIQDFINAIKVYTLFAYNFLK